MTTFPTCPREDCAETVRHWHAKTTGRVFKCHVDCSHVEVPGATRCYDPRPTPEPPTPGPIVLPTVDEVAQAILGRTATSGARAVLDLIASRVPVWQPVEPGDIKVGMRVRLVTAKGDEAVYTVTWRDREWINGADETRDVGIATHTWFVDPRTVPAEPEDPRVAVVTEWLREGLALDGIPDDADPDAARDLLARLDAAKGADQ